MTACTRCGTSLAYAGRPCPWCIGPVVFALAGGQVKAAEPMPGPQNVRLPEFALPPHLRGVNIRRPLRPRTVRALAIVGRWTWNSLVIAAIVHGLLFTVAFFMRHQIEQAVEHIHKVAFNTETVAPLAAPEPTVPEMPTLVDPGEELVMPDRVVETPERPGEPELVAPPEPLAPMPEVAPPRHGPELPISRIAPEGSEGLGGGQPRPSENPEASGSGLLRNREGESKEAAIKRFGGDDSTEAAVNLGLAYLARMQASDGSWDPTDGFAEGPSRRRNYSGYRSAITALCVLPFLAAGHSPTHGEYAQNVKRATNWLARQQTSTGAISSGSGIQMYSHTVATLALCEAYGLSGDKSLKLAAERAVRYLERTQGIRGGWDYEPRPITGGADTPERNDLSITGWAVLALKSARAVGIKVSDAAWKSLADLYDRHSLQSGETHYADQDYYAIPGTRKGIGMVGVGLTSRTILDADRFGTRNAAAERLLLKNLPSYDKFLEPSPGPTEPNFNTFYGLYCCTLGMFLKNEGRGLAWQAWNDALKTTLVDHQVKQGSRKGSWKPDDTWIGPLMGDFYSTACAILCLEVYYRYNPMHRPASEIPPVKPEPGASVDKPAGPGGEEAKQPVEIGGEVLDLEKPAERSRYLRLLARDKGLEAARVLIDHLSDTSASVRSTALYELGRLKAKDAVDPVCKMLTRSENRDLIGTICDTLGRIGDRAAAQPLVRLLRDEDTGIVGAARGALVKLADGKDFGINRHAWADYFGVNA